MQTLILARIPLLACRVMNHRGGGRGEGKRKCLKIGFSEMQVPIELIFICLDHHQYTYLVCRSNSTD